MTHSPALELVSAGVTKETYSLLHKTLKLVSLRHATSSAESLNQSSIHHLSYWRIGWYVGIAEHEAGRGRLQSSNHHFRYWCTDD